MDTAPAVPSEIATMLHTDGSGLVPAAAPPAAPVAVTVAEPAPGPEAGVAAPAAPVVEAPVFAGGRARSRTITLEWPLLFGGVLFETIVVTRPTTGQVAEFYERLLAQPDGAGSLRFPVFYSPDGTAIPDAVMSALDPDDDDRLMEAVSDFLPSRLRRLQAPQPDPSPLPAGDPIALTS